MKHIDEKMWKIPPNKVGKITSIIDILEGHGFVFNPLDNSNQEFGGHVDVKEVKPGHPYHTSYHPVGFISANYAMLVNTEIKFPEDYHAKLREIYDSFR